jgi:hypothetical protein
LVVSWELPESMIAFYDVGLPWFLHTILNHISSVQTILSLWKLLSLTCSAC